MGAKLAKVSVWHQQLPVWLRDLVFRRKATVDQRPEDAVAVSQEDPQGKCTGVEPKQVNMQTKFCRALSDFLV